MSNEEQADQLLQSGHLYKWGDRLFQANKGKGWSLLCIERETGSTVSPAPGSLCAYFLMRGVWYEALYENAQGKRVVGDAVDIDLTQLRDIASSSPIELLEGHIYSDGNLVYNAVKGSAPFVWMLHRVNIVNGYVVDSVAANSVKGYMQHKNGTWYVFRVGNQHSNRSHVTVPAPDFESEILPKLTHVADNLQDYGKNVGE